MMPAILPSWPAHGQGRCEMHCSEHPSWPRLQAGPSGVSGRHAALTGKTWPFAGPGETKAKAAESSSIFRSGFGSNVTA